VLNERDYFSMPGLDVMAFQDFYPEGHQGAVSIIQNGVRVASNGDLRLEPAPGQWAPVPVRKSRVVDRKANGGAGEIVTTLAYPDPADGWNRADWSYLPGGVVSGTALIRSDFPELKDFPFLWQHGEYVLGGGTTHFMLLVLGAARTSF
jgi:hypothetical protein